MNRKGWGRNAKNRGKKMEKDWGQIAKETGGVESQRDRGEIAKVGSNRKENPEKIGGVESQRKIEHRVAMLEQEQKRLHKRIDRVVYFLIGVGLTIVIDAVLKILLTL